jgi:hypothetical protein
MTTTGDGRNPGTNVDACSLMAVDWRRVESDTGVMGVEWVGLRREAADAEESSRCRTNRSAPTCIRINALGAPNVSHIGSYLQCMTLYWHDVSLRKCRGEVV